MVLFITIIWWKKKLKHKTTCLSYIFVQKSHSWKHYQCTKWSKCLPRGSKGLHWRGNDCVLQHVINKYIPWPGFFFFFCEVELMILNGSLSGGISWKLSGRTAWRFGCCQENRTKKSNTKVETISALFTTSTSNSGDILAHKRNLTYVW